MEGPSINSKLVFIIFGVYLVCCARALPSADVPIPNCGNVKRIFAAKNMSTTIPESAINGNSLSVCKAEYSCCTPDMEMNFKLLVKKEYQSLLQQNVMGIQGVLASSAIYFQGFVYHMLLKTENKTLRILNNAFGNVFDVTVKTFLNEMRVYCNSTTGQGAVDASRSASSSSSSSSSTDNHLARLTNTFFVRIFPILYETKLARGELHPEYKACLRERIDIIQPFSGGSKLLEKQIPRTLEAIKTLIMSMNYGTQMLNQSTQLILSTFSTQACYDALLKMTYCNYCSGQGNNIKPCSGYCLNVMRGCLSVPAAELDSSWNGYFEAIDKLAEVLNRGQSMVCLEDLLVHLHSSITEPILLINNVSHYVNVKERTEKYCGQAKLLNDSNGDQKETFMPSHHPDDELEGEDREVKFRTDNLSNKMKHLAEAVHQSRSLYTNFADSLCNDLSFAETRENAPCWNGQRVAEYPKSVLSISFASQKYNAEVPFVQQPKTTIDPRVLNLTEKLNFIKQLVQSKIMNSVSESLNQASDGDSGSGSGDGPAPSGQWNDDEDSEQDWPPNYSGSGDDYPPVTSVPDDVILQLPNDNNNQTDTKTVGDANRLTLNSLLVCVCFVLALNRILIS